MRTVSAALLVVALPLAWSAPAAAEPTADRPTLTDRARLVDSDTLELEGGVRWTNGSLSSPLLVKYAARGWIEPRIGMDSSGFDNGATGLHIGSKFAIVQTERQDFLLTAHLESAVPVASGDLWYGEAHVLMDLDLGGGVLLAANTGLDFRGPSGIQLYGVPLRFTLAAPLTQSLGVFGEGSTTIVGGSFTDFVVDGGLRWQLTSILQLDTSVGYLITQDAGWVGLGATANMGRLGG